MRVLKQRPRRRCARTRCAAAGLVFCAPLEAGALLLQDSSAKNDAEVEVQNRFSRNYPAVRRQREENFLLKSRKDATLDERQLPLLAKTARRDAPNPAKTNLEQRQADGGNKGTAPLDKTEQEAASALQMTDEELDRIDKKMLAYKLDKPLCPYSVDYVSGDYWLGDLCQLTLAPGAYLNEKSDETLLAAQFADVNPDNWTDGHKGQAITREIVGHASKHCAAAYNLAKFVQDILTRKPLKATADEKDRLKELGAADAED